MPASVIGPNPFVPGGFVLVEAAVLATMDCFRQDTAEKPEAGGILLGFRREPHLHVVEATCPAQHDGRRRYGFDRTAAAHQRIALQRWRQSNGTMDYLGEWHTHLEVHPRPSGIDQAAWLAIHQLRLHCGMVFIIAGDTQHQWCGIGQGVNLQQLQMTSVE